MNEIERIVNLLRPVWSRREPGPLKRYVSFAGAVYYPGGGDADFRGDADSPEEAAEFCDRYRREHWCGVDNRYNWCRVIDTHTGERVSHAHLGTGWIGIHVSEPTKDS